MALFNSGETKEEKQERKIKELMARYGLQELSDPRDFASAREIANCMMGNKMVEFGNALSGNGTDAAKLSYLRILMEQNFIIIRQLERLNRK